MNICSVYNARWCDVKRWSTFRVMVKGGKTTVNMFIVLVYVNIHNHTHKGGMRLIKLMTRSNFVANQCIFVSVINFVRLYPTPYVYTCCESLLYKCTCTINILFPPFNINLEVYLLFQYHTTWHSTHCNLMNENLCRGYKCKVTKHIFLVE